MRAELRPVFVKKAGCLSEKGRYKVSESVGPVPPDLPAVGSVEKRLRGASDWFVTADLLGDELVPAWAHWCAVHVRASVVDALRAGLTASLADLGLTRPIDGEQLEW